MGHLGSVTITLNNTGFWNYPEGKDVRVDISQQEFLGFAFNKMFASKQVVESPRSVDIQGDSWALPRSCPSCCSIPKERT